MPDPAWERSFNSTGGACRTVRVIRGFCSTSCGSGQCRWPGWAHSPLSELAAVPGEPGAAARLPPHVRGLLGALRERRAVELDTSLSALGRLAAALGVQMPWIPFSAPGCTGFGREGEAGRGMGASNCPGDPAAVVPHVPRAGEVLQLLRLHSCRQGTASAPGAVLRLGRGALARSPHTAAPAVAGRRRRALGRWLRVWVGTAVSGPAAFSQPPPGGGRSRRKGPARGAPDGSRGADRPHRRPPRTGPVLSRALAVHPHARRADQPGCGGDLSRPVAAASTAGCLRARRADQPLGHRGADVGLGGHRGHPPGALVGRSRSRRFRSRTAWWGRSATVTTGAPLRPMRRALAASMTIGRTPRACSPE
jgi:hypothetical protein